MKIAQIEATYGRPTAVVLLACRVYVGTVAQPSFDQFLLEDFVDWSEVCRLCRSHRIRPIVYRILLKAPVPSHWAETFKKELQTFAIQSIDRGRETARLVELLSQSGVVVFPYKGVAYSKLFYGDIGLRESGDIDLIVRRTDLPTINDLLKKDGYTPEEEDFQQFLGWERFSRTHRGYNLKKLSRKGLPVHLELHWRIIYDYFGVGKFDNDFTHEGSEKLEVYGKTFPVQDNLQQFKYLYMHHTLHDGHAYLKTALDIAMGLRTLQICQADYTENPLIREITEIFSFPAAVEASNQLFGTNHPVPSSRANLTWLVQKIIKNTLQEQAKRPEEVGKNFLAYLGFHTSLIRKRALFYPEISRKMTFYFQNFRHFFQPNFYDYRIFKPKSLFTYQLMWAIRPFRHFFAPTDPLRRDERMAEKATLKKINAEKP